MQFSLASCKTEYLPELIRIYTDAVRHAAPGFYTEAQIEAWAPLTADIPEWEASIEAHEAIVAMNHEDGVLGFADYHAKKLQINRLYVAPDAQGFGIGTRLLAEVEHALVQLGLQEAFTLESSLNARSFYEQQGYTCVGSRDVAFKGQSYRNLLMKKQIPGR